MSPVRSSQLRGSDRLHGWRRLPRPLHGPGLGLPARYRRTPLAAAGPDSSAAGTTTVTKPPTLEPLTIPPPPPTPAPLSSPRSSRSSLALWDEPELPTTSFEQEEAGDFHFAPKQLEVFEQLHGMMAKARTALMVAAGAQLALQVAEGLEPHHAEHALAEGSAAAVAAAAAAGGAVAAAAHGAAHEALSGLPLAIHLLSEITPADVSFAVDSLIAAALIGYAMVPFGRLAGANQDESHMVMAFEGVSRLSLIMQQLAISSSAVGVVLLLDAASTYPKINGLAASALLALAVARAASLWWVLSRHTSTSSEVSRTLAALRGGSVPAAVAAGPGSGAAASSADIPQLNLLDRIACSLAMGTLLQYERRPHRSAGGGHAATPHGSGGEHADAHGEAAAAAVAVPGAAAAEAVVVDEHPPYMFTGSEERLLRTLVEAGNNAGLALSLQALATLVLGFAELAVGESSGMVSNALNAAQKGANAALIFGAAATFDRALHNDDGLDDSSHLLEGLSAHHGGMGELFERLAVTSWALVLAGCLGLVLPWVEHDPMALAAAEMGTHRLADVVVEAVELLAKLI